MQHPYSLDCLTPLRVHVDSTGATHAVYRLPAPKAWMLRYHAPQSLDYVEKKENVSKVRVCLFTCEETRQPEALVIPFGPDGQEYLSSTVIISGVLTYTGVLAKMGFTPLFNLQ